MGSESRKILLVEINFILLENVNKRKCERATSRQVLFNANDANQ